MNNARRKIISSALELLRQANELIETAQSEEQEAYDNMPESLQSSDRGQLTEQNAEALQQAFDDLESVIGSLEEIG